MEKNECLICGKPLYYYETGRELACSLCGNTFLSNASRSEEHTSELQSPYVILLPAKYLPKSH